VPLPSKLSLPRLAPAVLIAIDFQAAIDAIALLLRDTTQGFMRYPLILVGRHFPFLTSSPS
jgi:hypothetical protein